MKRTIAFPSVTSRQHSNFDGSEGNNLTLLHHPKRLQRDRVYENTDPDYMRRHVPTLVHLEKDRSPRFPSTSHETLEKREEAVASRTDASREQEERRKLLNATAMRGSFLLSSSLLRERSTVRDALLARRNERDQLALKTFPRDHFISTHRSSPQITMTKAERDPPHLKAQAAASMVNTTTPPRGKRITNHSDEKAEALEVGRSETAPPQLNPSFVRRPSQSPFPVAHDGAVGGGSKLADFLLPQIGSAPLPPPPSSSPPPQQPARTEAKKDADRAEHEDVVLERPETPPSWTWGVPRHVSGPSLARTVGRDAPICHSPQPQVHPYEQANSSAPLLDVTSAMVKSKLRHVPTIALLASGREPLQPAPIPEDDPLFRASVRYQHDMNNSICPGFNTMQAKKKANAKKRRDDRNKEWKAFASTEDLPMVEEVDVPDKVHTASGKTQKQGIPRRRSVVFTASAPDDGASGAEGSKSQSHKGQKKAGLPNSSSDRHGKIYTVARGSSRVEVNVNELYKTKRFQELLSMHDLLVQQSLESLTSSKIRKADEDAAQRANQQRQGYSSVRRSSSSSSDSSNDAPSSPNGKKKHHPDAGPSLPWAPAVAMTFDEALAESERRQQLLGLRRLSMLRDDASTKPDLSVLRRRSSAVNIGQGPGRFDSVASPTRTGNRSGDELELRATSGLQAVKGGVNLPESGLFRAHMRLKECYEQFVAENQTRKTLQELAATT